MGVQQQLMALGDWSLTLTEDTPIAVRQAITTPYSHIVITPEWVNPNRATDGAILAGSIYTGVVLDPGPQLQLAGVGLVWWLGDNNGDGPVLEAVVSFGGSSFSTVMTTLLPSSLSAGSIEGYPGSHVANYQWMSRRKAIDAALVAFGGLEYRVNNDFTFDAGEVSYLYPAAPGAIAVRASQEGRDGTMVGLDADIGYKVSYDGTANRVVLLARAGPIASGAATAFRDGRGNAVSVVKVVEGSSVAPGAESTAVLAELALVSTPQQELTIDTDTYAVAGKAKVGEYLYVFDPILGLVDTANQVVYQGRRLFPVKRRIYGIRWPITDGMGVLFRTRTASAVAYTDLTPYVQFEDGTTQIDVGFRPRSLTTGET